MSFQQVVVDGDELENLIEQKVGEATEERREENERLREENENLRERCRGSRSRGGSREVSGKCLNRTKTVESVISELKSRELESRLADQKNINEEENRL